MGSAMDGFSTLDLALFAAGTFAAAFVTGLVGFAFGIVAAAVWLHFLTPGQAAPLIVAFGLIVQGVSVWKLRRAVKINRIAPFIVGSAIGVPLGIWAALHRNRLIDYAARLLSLIGLSFPVFVSGIFILLVFALHWRLFPVIGNANLSDPIDRLDKLVLPAATLGLVMAAYITRVTRSAMLSVLGEDYIRTARAKGIPWRRIVWRHGLRNAAMPVVTVVGLYIGILIGNSVLTEIVFNRPGLGKIIVGALNQRDYTMLQGLMVIYCFLIVVVNLITDLTYGIIDPRVKQ
jgi:ABC-type dipeptide/oligopeptide/nickel transport system permease component